MDLHVLALWDISECARERVSLNVTTGMYAITMYNNYQEMSINFKSLSLDSESGMIDSESGMTGTDTSMAHISTCFWYNITNIITIAGNLLLHQYKIS